MRKNILKKGKVPFTQVPNILIDDLNTSLKAKGLYLHMVSKPDDWNFTIFSMSRQIKDGETSIRNALAELKKLGWVVYKKYSDGTGEYFINYEPKLENPHMEKSKMIKPTCGKPTAINNKHINNTNKESNKEHTNIEVIEGLDSQYLVKYLQHLGLSNKLAKNVLETNKDNLNVVYDACIHTESAIAKKSIKTTNQNYFFGVLQKLQGVRL
jgi:hypothetical protein